MSLPTFRVDFNELLVSNLVLLSAGDEKEDANGESVVLIEGMRIAVWDEDLDQDGVRDDLIATGVVARNVAGGSARWCCLIDERGIRHQSDV